MSIGWGRDSAQPHHALWSGIGAILLSPVIAYAVAVVTGYDKRFAWAILGVVLVCNRQ